MVDGVTDLVHGSAKIDADDQEADPTQLFWALNNVPQDKDIIYDISNEIEQMKNIAKEMPDGDQKQDPQNWQLANVLFNFAYAYQKSIRSGGSLNSTMLKILTTNSQTMKYEQIMRGQKAEGTMGKGGSFFGFGKKPQQQNQPMAE